MRIDDLLNHPSHSEPSASFHSPTSAHAAGSPRVRCPSDTPSDSTLSSSFYPPSPPRSPRDGASQSPLLYQNPAYAAHHHPSYRESPPRRRDSAISSTGTGATTPRHRPRSTPQHHHHHRRASITTSSSSSHPLPPQTPTSASSTSPPSPTTNSNSNPTSTTAAAAAAAARERREFRPTYVQEEECFIWYHRVDLGLDWSDVRTAYNAQFPERQRRGFQGIQCKYYRCCETYGVPRVRDRNRQGEGREAYGVRKRLPGLWYAWMRGEGA